MSRIPRLTERFLRSRARLGIRAGSPEGADVSRVIGQLTGADALPGPGDARALMPPTGEAFVRRVPGRNLWIWYRADGETLYVVPALQNRHTRVRIPSAPPTARIAWLEARRATPCPIDHGAGALLPDWSCRCSSPTRLVVDRGNGTRDHPTTRSKDDHRSAWCTRYAPHSAGCSRRASEAKGTR